MPRHPEPSRLQACLTRQGGAYVCTRVCAGLRAQIRIHARVRRESGLLGGNSDHRPPARLFLLRDSQSNPKAFVLTLCHHQKVKNFQILPVSTDVPTATLVPLAFCFHSERSCPVIKQPDCRSLSTYGSELAGEIWSRDPWKRKKFVLWEWGWRFREITWENGAPCQGPARPPGPELQPRPGREDKQGQVTGPCERPARGQHVVGTLLNTCI